MTNTSNDIGQFANLIRIPELIFVLIISLTMLSVDGKLFWVLNLIGVILKIFIGCSYILANS